MVILSERSINDLNEEEEQRALYLHRKATVINSLDASTLRYWRPDGEYRHEYYPSLRKGGVTAIFVNVVLDYRDRNFLHFGKRMSALWRLCEKNHDISLIATSVEDIKKAKEEGKIAWVLTSQYIEIMENDVSLLAVLHRLGLRCLQLTYSTRNPIGDGCSERTDSGLSRLGIEVVEEMNRLGILIDLSHVGPASTMEAIKCSKDPVCFTHTCTRALSDQVRCKSDETIKALAEKGGVMGFSSNSMFTKVQGWAKGDTTIEDYLDHFDYVIDLVGVNHVGIGTDCTEGWTYEEWCEILKIPHDPSSYRSYNWERKYVKGLRTASELPNLTRGLVARGYSDQEILKILGGSFLRIMKKVW